MIIEDLVKQKCHCRYVGWTNNVTGLNKTFTQLFKTIQHDMYSYSTFPFCSAMFCCVCMSPWCEKRVRFIFSTAHCLLLYAVYIFLFIYIYISASLFFGIPKASISQRFWFVNICKIWCKIWRIHPYKIHINTEICICTFKLDPDGSWPGRCILHCRGRSARTFRYPNLQGHCGESTKSDIRSAYGDPRNIIMSTTKGGIDNENEAWD